jgi:predicted dehydrogenase
MVDLSEKPERQEGKLNEKLRVGILGAGWAGGGHATAFSRLPNVQVVALWSRTRKSAETLAAQLNDPNLKVYDDWRDLVEQAEVDAITLATPPTLRVEPIVMALNRGCHVLVEKPVTVGLKGAKAIREAVHQKDLVSAAVLNWRYAPGNLTAKRAIEEGLIGNVLDVRAEWRINWMSAEFLEQRPWTKEFATSDGILGEGVSHDLDRVRFLTGQEFKRVVSKLVTRPLPGDPDVELAGGNSIILTELTNNIIADIQLTLTAGFPKWNLIINGETGTLNVTHETALLQNLNEDEARALDPIDADKIPEETDILQHIWNRLIADFVTAIHIGDKARKKVVNLPTLEDGLKVQQTISAARLSDKESRWVNLHELE